MTKLLPATVFPNIFLQTHLKSYTSAVAAALTFYLDHKLFDKELATRWLLLAPDRKRNL
jgi:hypothetical protein